MLVPLRKAVELTGLCGNTLRKYADTGRIRVKKIGGGRRLFDTSDLLSLAPGAKPEGAPVVCYCRVSSAKQRDDLARQVAFMRNSFPDSDIIQDVGSGLNFRRKGLQSILRRLLQGDKFTLIVAHRDRLCRFGFDLLQFLFESNGGEIVVLDKTDVSPEQELTEDLLAILHVFSCRLHGLRRYERQIKEDKGLSDDGAEEPVPPVDGGVEEVL